MPKLYVLVGVPAAGKTTWVSNQLWAEQCAYISTDRYVEKFARRLGKTYSEVFELVMPRAIRLMMLAVRKARTQGLDIIWDQTSTTLASRQRKFRALPDYYAIAVVFPIPPTQELARRLASRPEKAVPWTVVSEMASQLNSAPPTESEGFKEIWRV